jgi:transposase
MTKCFLFTLRMSHSGRAVHRVFASQGQEAFVEGHVAAFEILGGVPTRHIRYDNLRSAVHRELFRGWGIEQIKRPTGPKWRTALGARFLSRIPVPGDH